MAASNNTGMTNLNSMASLSGMYLHGGLNMETWPQPFNSALAGNTASYFSMGAAANKCAEQRKQGSSKED